MVTYEQWNKAIITHFFEDGEPGQIVFLQTDTDTIFEIAEKFNFRMTNAADAVESLKVAVRNKVIVAGFEQVTLSQINPTDPDSWTYSSQKDPPQAAFLALTVLAASEMEKSDEASQTNYYVQLNKLLFDKPYRGCPKGIHLWQIEKCWKYLQKWASYEYDTDLYLTEGASNYRYVWYPISQSLVSKHDRRSVYQLFHRYNLTPFSDFPDDRLEEALDYWAHSSAFAGKIRRYLSNPFYKKSILGQVKSLLQHWDGEIPPEPTHSARQATAPINVEFRFNIFDNVGIRYWFPRRGRDEIDCRINPLEVKRLQTLNSEKWFRPVTDKKGAFWNLSNRLQLRTDETNPIIYTLGSSDIWVFREETERGEGWFSQRNMQLYEDHLVVFHERFAAQVMDCLKKICGQEIEKPNAIYVDGKANDWLYLPVKPIESETFSDQNLWRFSVVSGERISLIGGLSVRDHNDRRAYLDICLPTIFVPDLGLSDQEPLWIDDQAFSVGEDRLVALDNALDPGFYLLTYGRQTRELRVISPERSLEHHDQTLLATISQDQTAIPTYCIKKIEEVSGKFGLWFAGVKFFGTDIPEVSWKDMEEIPPEPPPPEPSFKVPANVISSIVQVAIDFKQGKPAAPEWLNEALEYLDQNVALRALVEKKLNIYHEIALSYVELREHIGR